MNSDSSLVIPFIVSDKVATTWMQRSKSELGVNPSCPAKHRLVAPTYIPADMQGSQVTPET